MKKKTKKIIKQIATGIEREIMRVRLLGISKQMCKLVLALMAAAFIRIGILVLPQLKELGITYVSGCCLIFMIYLFSILLFGLDGFIFLGGMFMSVGLVFDKPAAIYVGLGVIFLGMIYLPIYAIRKEKEKKK